MRIFVFLIMSMCAAGSAAAQQDSSAALLDALTARTPGAVLSRISDDPERFLIEASGLILGYGTGSKISLTGIEDAIETERAALRARDIRRLLIADLNDDLAVDARELDVAIRAASATMRGRLLNWHLSADLDTDGVVAWQELRAFARARSLTDLDEDAADAMRSIMVFDLNGDRFVSVAEVREALDLLGAAA